jgi:hypothetical protein
VQLLYHGVSVTGQHERRLIDVQEYPLTMPDATWIRSVHSYNARPAATKAKNPRATDPTWRFSAPLPEEPVEEAEADAPVAELPSMNNVLPVAEADPSVEVVLAPKVAVLLALALAPPAV